MAHGTWHLHNGTSNVMVFWLYDADTGLHFFESSRYLQGKYLNVLYPVRCVTDCLRFQIHRLPLHLGVQLVLVPQLVYCFVCTAVKTHCEQASVQN